MASLGATCTAVVCWCEEHETSWSLKCRRGAWAPPDLPRGEPWGEGGKESSADRSWNISRCPEAEEGAGDSQMRRVGCHQEP